MSQISKIGSTGGIPGVVPVTFPDSYPYQMLPTDRAIIVDTNQARTVSLMPSPLTGYTVSFKDDTGMSGANPITIDGNGNNIDGQTVYMIQFNYGFAGMRYNGIQWNIISS